MRDHLNKKPVFMYKWKIKTFTPRNKSFKMLDKVAKISIHQHTYTCIYDTD